MNEKKYIPPKYLSKAFNCPHCNAFSHQKWSRTGMCMKDWGNAGPIPKLQLSFCDCCKEYAIWYDKKMIYPISSNAPLPAD